MFPVLILAVVVVPVLVVRAYRDVDDAVVSAWATAHSLDLTPESRPMVGWYLRTARILRTWGAVGGVILPGLCALAWSGHLEVVGFDTDGGVNLGDLGWIFVGYLVGVLVAEVSLVRPVDPYRRAASIVPRDLDAYLPPRVVLAQRVIGAAIVAGVLLSLALPYDERWAGPNAVSVLVVVAWVAAVTTGLERLQRWLVRRPQPFADPSLVAADGAIRSQSVHSLAGAGLAFLLLMFAGVAMLLFASDVAVLRWTMWLPALVATLAALVACQHLGHRAWPVRRTTVSPPAAATG